MGGVGEAVGADLGGIGVIDKNEKIRLIKNPINQNITETESKEFGGIGDDGADGGVSEGGTVEGLIDGIGAELRGWNDYPPIGERFTIGEGEFGACIGVVDEELHERGYFSRISTS